MNKKPTIILASKSPSRSMIMSSTGIPFDTQPADIDEAGIKKKALAKNHSPEEIGIELARKKALKISKDHPDCLVIGADQILELEGEMFTKPKTMAEARNSLERLKGKTHTLISCVALAFGGKVVKEFQDKAHLTMKNFSSDFLDNYLKEAGPGILTSVGAYQLEGLGKILFEEIKGDFFTILGLPRDRLMETLKKIAVGPKA